MSLFFAAIPLQEHTADNFALEYAGNLAAVLYRGVFYGYLVYCLIWIAILCRRNAITAAAQGRSGPDPESRWRQPSACRSSASAPSRPPSPLSPGWDR